MVNIRKFPPGTVVRYSDEHGGEVDRSYRVVFKWNQEAGTVQMKLSAPMPNEPEPEMETARTDQLIIIAHCQPDGSIEWA
jgi:hypothetical protein